MAIDKKTLVVVGASGAALLLFLFRKQVAQVGTIVIDDAKKAIFNAVISDAAEIYSDVILQVAAEQSVDPFVIVALGEQETRWGTGPGYTPRGSPTGTGDGGHGRGLMQIDDRTWSEWLATHDWGDPYTNITKGVEILKGDLAYFAGKGLVGGDQLMAALAAYNHGPGKVWSNIEQNLPLDAGTTNPTYSTDVAAILARLNADFMSAVDASSAALGRLMPDNVGRVS